MSSELAGSGQSGEEGEGWGRTLDTQTLTGTCGSPQLRRVQGPGSTPQSMACISIRMNWTEQLWCDGCGAAVNASSARAVSPCALLSAQPSPAQPSPAQHMQGIGRGPRIPRAKQPSPGSVRKWKYSSTVPPLGPHQGGHQTCERCLMMECTPLVPVSKDLFRGASH